MKALLFAAAISISGIAIAQDTSSQGTAQPSGQTVNDPSQATGPQGVTQQGTVPNGQATAPAGYNQGVQTTTGSGTMGGTGSMGTTGSMGGTGMSSSGGMGGTASAGNYPPCSRTVTDSCIQTYERGVRRSARRR